MKHRMRLNRVHFFKIKDGSKVIEVRLFDENRQKVRIGDKIEFSIIDSPEEKLLVSVFGLSRFNNFKDLFSSFDYKKFGHSNGITVEQQVKNEYNCYTVEKEIAYGVLGIHIDLIE